MGKEEEEKRKTEMAETMAEVAKKVPKQTSSVGVSGTALKPLQSSKRVPQFYIPVGSSILSSTELDSAMAKLQACILEGLATSVPSQKGDNKAEKTDSKNAEAASVTTATADEEKEEHTQPTKLTVEYPIPFSRFDIVTKVGG